jgi:hypothetical protein
MVFLSMHNPVGWGVRFPGQTIPGNSVQLSNLLRQFSG